MAQFLKDEIKDQIKISAVRVFTEKGYQKASIKEIAEDANASVGNVYRYYKNKEDLYCQVIKKVYDGLHQLMLNEAEREFRVATISVKDGSEDVKLRLIKPLEEFIELYKKERLVFNMLLKGEKDSHYDQSIQYFIDLLKEHLFKLWNQSEDCEFDMVEISAFTNAMVFGVIDLLEKVEEEDLDRRLIAFAAAMINGYYFVKKDMEEKDEK